MESCRISCDRPEHVATWRRWRRAEIDARKVFVSNKYALIVKFHKFNFHYKATAKWGIHFYSSQLFRYNFIIISPGRFVNKMIKFLQFLALSFKEKKWKVYAGVHSKTAR